jgi:hypothetical protein
MQIQHTVEWITKSVKGAILDTAAELFPMVEGKFPDSLAISITNTDANDAMYVRVLPMEETNDLSTTVFTEKIPATESRQFQIKRGNGVVNQKKQLRIYILGASTPGTTYTADCWI